MQNKVAFIACLLCCALLLGVFAACIKEDEVAPDVVLKNLTWAVGTALPTAQDFVSKLPEGADIRFAKEYTYPNLGSYLLDLIVTDARGRETAHRAQLTLIVDEEPPVIHGADDISVYLNDGISYRNGVTVSDNCNGAVKLDIDSSAVDITKEGSYPVTYTATDAAGNRTVVEITVYVWKEAVSEDMLFAELDKLIAERITAGASVEKQVRDVYRYVYNNIDYVSDSDKSDWVRAAYEGIRTGRGDCFTYFALSKAFFVRLGIENKDIKRTEGIVTERHYWNLVNIGTATSPRWYHFDACQIKDATHSGCLLTDLQLAAFSSIRTDANGVCDYFYAYDDTGLPARETKIVTETPSLEPYY